MKSHHKSVTLIELLIAISLLSVIVLGFTSIDIFSQHHVITSQMRAKVQNEVSYVLEHMTKEISKAINLAGETPFHIPTSNQCGRSGGSIRYSYGGMDFYADLGSDKSLPGDGRAKTQGDCWRAYCVIENPTNGEHEMRYCSDCFHEYCGVCKGLNWQSGATILLSQKIANLQIQYFPPNNYIEVKLIGCWDPKETKAKCGSPDNPSVTMSTRIKMPSVSTH